MRTVTVIIPIYRGRHFFPGLCKMMERNSANAKKESIGLEAIFVDDSAEKEIDASLINAKGFDYKILYNNKNMGIHYSRVRGVQEATGEYIFFLDQDDIISDQLVVQLVNAIGNHDAVVSNAYVYGRALFADAKDIEAKMRQETRFPYPGQVLLRKSSVPVQWMSNILKYSCADDTYLWMLMLRQKRSIFYVDKKLYCHVSTGENTSEKYENMLISLREMLSYLSIAGYIDKDQIENALKKWEVQEDKCEQSITERKLSLQIKILDRWMEIKEQGLHLYTYLYLYDIRRVMIYGMGILGRHLYSELMETSIEICGIMDQQQRGYMSIPVYRIGDVIGTCDAIVITVVDEYDKIKTELMKHYTCRILSLEAMLTSVCTFD